MALRTTVVLGVYDILDRDSNPRAGSCWTYGLGRADAVAAIEHGFFEAFAVVFDGIMVETAAETNAGDSTVSMAMAAAHVVVKSAENAVVVPCSAAPTESAIATSSSSAGFLVAFAVARDVAMFADFAVVGPNSLHSWLPFQPCFASPSNNFGSTIGTAIAHHAPHVVQCSENSIVPLYDQRARRQSSVDKYLLSLN